MYSLIPQSTTQAALASTAALLIYLFCLAVYRLYLHPLSRYPGSKLAALTLWYEFYYDVVLRGQFYLEIARMHEKYGPIVRINPHELHISDPDFYDIVFVGAGTRRTEKYAWSANMFHIPGSMLSTVSHELHRARRQPLNQFFSRASVAKLEPVIKSKIDTLCRRLEAIRGSGAAMALNLAYTCLTTDIITEYSFGRSWGYIDRDDFAPEWTRMMAGGTEAALLNKQIPWFFPLMKALPMWLVVRLNPDIVPNITFRQDLQKRILEVKAGAQGESESEGKESRTPTIFQALLESNIPDSEKSVQRLAEEAQTVVSAGTLTTSHFLTATTYHVLANPPILKRLRQELENAIPDPAHLPSTVELEKLPYLSAVVNEGMRITYGITSRLTRVSPDQPLQFSEWTIPAGTPVGMSAMMQHTDPTLFPSPYTFDPERFLDGGSKLEKYLVSFSRGTRGCIGINLARAELFLALAAVMRRFGGDLELFETDRSDVDVAHDFFTPAARLDSKGMRVVVKDSGGR